MLITIVTIPLLLFTPFPKPYVSIHPREFPNYFIGGMKCIIGINSQHSDLCNHSYIIIFILSVLNIIYNYVLLYIFKEGSSTLAMIAGAARLAFSNIGFLIPIIAGEVTEQRISILGIEALFILIVGVVMYSLTKEKHNKSYSILDSLNRKILFRNQNNTLDVEVNSGNIQYEG
jgi:hypothetical protein